MAGCTSTWSGIWIVRPGHADAPPQTCDGGPIAALGTPRSTNDTRPPADGAVLVASQGLRGPWVQRGGELGGTVVGPSFGDHDEWAIIQPEGGDPYLSITRRDGALRLTLHAGCHGDGCTSADVEWLRGPRYFWLPEVLSSAQGAVIVAYDPELGQAGLGARVSPYMRRVAAGGLAVGLSAAYVDLGTRQRFAVNLVVEYDLSYLARSELGGNERRLQLAIGTEAGLGVAAAASDFGQALVLGAALDPYAELRFVPAPSVAIPVRVSVALQLAAQVSYHAELSAGIRVAW